MLAPALERIDHLVLATGDVGRSIAALESRLGVRAAPGGRHPAWGTHNALIALGARTYLEIVGPEPGAPAPAGPRPFGLDAPPDPWRLATWVAVAAGLEGVVERARAAGIDLGACVARSRERPDGTTLRWSMTDSMAPREGGVIPFFIDWGASEHPATTSPAGGRLIDLRVRHPEPGRIRTMLRALDLEIEIEAGPAPELIATIENGGRTIELR